MGRWELTFWLQAVIILIHIFQGVLFFQFLLLSANQPRAPRTEWLSVSGRRSGGGDTGELMAVKKAGSQEDGLG